MSEESINTDVRTELRRLAREIERLDAENDQLRRRVSDLELQTGQLTERVMRNGSCSSCGI